MFSGFVLSVLTVVPLFAHYVAAAPRCNDIDIKGCMDELKLLTSNQDLGFAQTDQELTRTCGHLQEAMQCVNDFTRRCFDETQRELYRTLTSGAQQLLSDLCTQGSDFRSRYLVHAGCYKSLSSEYKKCADNFLHQQESAKRSDMHVRDKLKKSCCLFDGYKACTRQVVLAKCSPEAADLGEQIVTKAGGPLVEAHCSNFKHNSPDCYFPSSGLSSMTFSSLHKFYMSIMVVLAALFYRR